MRRSHLIAVIEALHVAIGEVVANWETGDLAGAVHELEIVDKEHAVPALAWWEADE